jgi:hypothetical protein
MTLNEVLVNMWTMPIDIIVNSNHDKKEYSKHAKSMAIKDFGCKKLKHWSISGRNGGLKLNVHI